MNADVKENDVTKVFLVQTLVSSRITLQSTNEGTSPKNSVVVVSASVVAVVITFLVILCLCRRRKRRRIRKGRVVSTSTTTTTTSPVYVIPSKAQLRTTQDVTKRYQRSVSTLSAKNQIFLVPFSVLPPDFDFASREVEVRADYVILKDLSLLERYNSSDGGVINEAYEMQEPYNPNMLNGAIPHGLVGEAYQKQSPYNPTFY